MSQLFTKFILSVALVAVLSGCHGFADTLNPYTDSVGTELGQRDTSALGGGGAGKQAAVARQALEVMGTYQRAQAPQPYYPVIRPADIRLMWIPDHLNRLGDLVPAHYYYLRVTRDTPALQDAFEIEREISSRVPSGYSGTAPAISAPAGGAPAGEVSPGVLGGATPWQYKENKQ